MNRHSERGGKSPLGMRRNNGVGAPDTDSFFHHLFVFLLRHLRPTVTPRRPAQDDCEPIEYVRCSRPHSLSHPSDDQLRSTLAATVQH
jgi:hypothetical protein